MSDVMYANIRGEDRRMIAYYYIGSEGSESSFNTNAAAFLARNLAMRMGENVVVEIEVQDTDTDTEKVVASKTVLPGDTEEECRNWIEAMFRRWML